MRSILPSRLSVSWAVLPDRRLRRRRLPRIKHAVRTEGDPAAIVIGLTGVGNGEDAVGAAWVRLSWVGGGNRISADHDVTACVGEGHIEVPWVW